MAAGPTWATTGRDNESRFPPGSTLLGRYRIISALGKGGMGEVYRADDLRLHQQVALKFLPRDLLDDPDLLARLHQEVRIARQISHRLVCRVHDIAEVDGETFLTMEFIDGEDLGSLLKRIGRLPEDKGIEIAHQLCEGLAAVHEKGIVHRDLKPLNIMIDGRGQARLTDFGLAVIADTIPTADFLSGTPGYMAPEQLAGGSRLCRATCLPWVWSCTRLFTGRRAFRQRLGKSWSVSTMSTGRYRSATSCLDSIRVSAKVVRHRLEREPSQRPVVIQEVAAALPRPDPLATALAEGRTPSPETVANALTEAPLPLRWQQRSSWQQCWAWSRRRPGEPGDHLRTRAPETLAARPGRQGAGGFRPPRL